MFDMNAQTVQLSLTLERGGVLTTRRRTVFAQLILCEGCCCGRTERGFPPVPKDAIKAAWKSQRLNDSVQLTVSGCLGPCDVANVACILTAEGETQWLGGLGAPRHYELLVDWAVACRAEDRLLPLPPELERHRFERFEAPSETGPACQAGGQASPSAHDAASTAATV